MEACCAKAEHRLCISVLLLKFTIIVNSLTLTLSSNFTPITSMLKVKLTLFLRYADWLTCQFGHFFLFFVLQCDWLVMSERTY